MSLPRGECLIKSIFVWIVMLLPGSVAAQTRHRLVLNPFDFQEPNQVFLTSTVSQVIRGEPHLYVKSGSNPEVYQLDLNGKYLATIGGKGGGPTELGYYWPLAMSAHGEKLWVIDSDGKFVKCYEGGVHKGSLKLSSYLVHMRSDASNAFGSSDDFLVIPSHSQAREVATVYDLNDHSNLKKLERIDAIPPHLLAEMPYLNDTLWCHDQGNWYGVFIYFPVIMKWDLNFAHLDFVNVDSPVIGDALEAILDFNKAGRGSHPQPLFFDFSVQAGRFALMTLKHLLLLGLDTGRVEQEITFFGKGSHFPQASPDLHFDTFAFIGERSVVLGNSGMLWGHDLWQVTIPELPDRSAP